MGQVEILVGHDQFDPYLGIKVQKLTYALAQPHGADANRSGDLEIAFSALARFSQASTCALKPHLHVAGGYQEVLAVLGQEEATSVTMKEWYLQLTFETADLTADRRLAQADGFTRPCEAARLCH